jgi:hypothetical protein
LLTFGTRASAAFAGLCLACGMPLLAQASYRPDAAPRAPRFARDTLFQSAVIAHRVLQVRAELDSAPRPGGSRLTGRYTVHAVYPNRSRLIAARLLPAQDAPSVAFISAGDPAVVVLSSFTGGGRSAGANYSFKIVVAEAEQFRTFTVEPDSSAAFASPDIKGFDRGPTGSFTLRFADGPSVRYRGGRLTLSTSAAQR